MEKTIYMDKLNVIDKSLLIGQTVTVRELLKGLKSKTFSSAPKESPVTICTTGEVTEPLTVIYKCNDCDSLHLEGGYFNAGYNVGDVLYVDKSNKIGSYVSRGELISLIEDDGIDLDSTVIVYCSDDSSSYPMTMLIKCSEDCPSTHILAHVKNEIIMN